MRFALVVWINSTDRGEIRHDDTGQIVELV